MGVNGIYGLSGSGLDIESMVKVGMMGKQNEYDRMYKKETRANWQKEAYVEVYNSINDFNNSKLTDYKLQSKMNAMTASTNNEKAFTVSANGSAVPMSHKVEVKSLSSNAYLMSNEAIERNDSADESSILLSDSMFHNITDNGNGTYSVKDWNRNTKTVNADDIALSVTLNDGKSSATDEARTITMTYADIAGGKTLNDLVSSINKLGLNITASYDSVNDSFSLYNKNGGEENTIAIKTNNANTAALFNNFNLAESRNGELTPFTATAPGSIVGTEYTGSKNVADILGLTVSSTRTATYVNDKMVEPVEDAALDANGIKRYSKVYGSTDYLVKTSTEDVQKYNVTVKEQDEDGNEVENVVSATLAESMDGGNLLRYARDDGKGDIIVKATKDGDNTTYQMKQVESGATKVSWDGVESTSTNPAQVGDLVTENRYQIAEVERGTSEVAWDTVESTSTNPVKEESTWKDESSQDYIIDGKYVAKLVSDPTLEAKGIQRYQRTDGQGDVLVRTATDNGKPFYKVAAVESGTSDVDWNEIEKVSADPVSTKTVAKPESKTVIGDDIVTAQGAADANGVTTYTKDSGGTVYVKATEEPDPSDATATITKYQSVDVQNVNPSVLNLNWDGATSATTNPVDDDGAGNLTINGEAVTKTAEDTDNGIVTYKETNGSKIYYVKTEKSTDNTDPDNPLTSYSYKTLSESDIDASKIDWDKVSESTTNPVSTASFMKVGDEYKKTDDTALSFNLDDGQGTAKTVSVSYGALANFTIDDVVNLINATGTTIHASFEDGKFSLVNTNAGDGYKNNLSFNDENSAKFFNALGINNENITPAEGTGSAFNAGKETTIAGSNGEIVVDGRSYKNITDNRATIGGVTYTLLDKTETAATVTVTQDQDSIVDRVKQFVEDYNTMLQSLQDKYNETKYSDYDVLTKAQEDAMTKEQVEKWNNKAKSGLLNRDSYIGTIISKMREALSTPVDGVSGKYNSAFSIGISTITDQGKIELDEDKLKKVLSEEPNSVYEIFGKMGDYDSNTKTSDFSTSGVAQRLSDVYATQLKNLKTHAGVSNSVDDNSDLGNKIKEWQNKMSDFKTKMTAFENLLYKKYDAMEMALQKLAMTMNYVSFNQQ